MTNLSQVKNVISLYAFILVVWGFYRFIAKLPDTVEEAILKPIIWLGPTFFMVHRAGGGLESLGWTTKNLFKTLYISIGLGILFAILGLLSNFLKYGGINFVSLGGGWLLLVSGLTLSFVTAISEETVFRGYIFATVWKILKSEWTANFITTIGWVLVHAPVYIFILKLDLPTTAVSLFLTFLFGLSSAFIYARTGNILSSVLLHVFWEWPILLFR